MSIRWRGILAWYCYTGFQLFLGDFDQRLIGFVGPSGCCWRMTSMTSLSQASVSVMYRPLAQGSDKIDGDTSRFCIVFIVLRTSSVRSSTVWGWCLISLFFRASAIRAKFETNRPKSLHSPNEARISVTMRDSLRSFIASDVGVTGYSLLPRMMYTK